mgnify:CR=1 FL=1
MVLPRFVASAIKGEPITVYGDGSQSRVFCHVSDAVDGILRIFFNDRALGEAFNIGGEEEVTLSALESRKIAGVVSSNPAYVMNSEQTGLKVCLALVGRVPCKVTGPVCKGQMMVSAGNGRARAESKPTIGSVIGKALENNTDGENVIEIVVGRL